ncbi:hypothetical protein NHP21005_14190 [Helicobacter sp. NHP21005]|uniref:hypothetical protein n=1 Tax=Helicobacter felistomachi TaxID=3040201 RepID=UPI0025727643|nr:hypothetical protein [Helicobacter sp. NHP21005]BEG57731.1 hypothetical protein NHP21005_14190 [Helicobacter sp. NHP21005]
MYAYVFVILDQKVGVFKRTQQRGLVFVCMQEAGADFFTNFNEIYNIEPGKARDFCFVYPKESRSPLLQSTYFKPQLKGSVWGPSLLCDLLNLLYMQHGLKACLQDNGGHSLGEALGSVVFCTNADLSPQKTLSPKMPHNSEQSGWQQEEWEKTKEYEKARGKKHQEPATAQPIACKLSSEGGDKPPTTQETNH